MPSLGPSATCRYPVSLDALTLTLADGRLLSYAEYGNPAGAPILYLPGFPSSRIEGAGLHPDALLANARIIAIDRPGYGHSTAVKSRTVLSHAADVEALASHLGLERYGVLGISGGGPYALACAKALPADKLRAVCIVCGLGSPDMGYWGMNWISWCGWTFVQRIAPWYCRWWFSKEPGARLDLDEQERMKLVRRDFEKGKAKMSAKDVAMFGDEDWMWMHIRRSEEVYRQGMVGMSQDFRVLNSDFGFRIEDVRKDLRVSIWHGRLDDMVPLQHAEKVKERLGENATLNITDDTHASIWQERREEFLGELVQAVVDG